MLAGTPSLKLHKISATKTIWTFWNQSTNSSFRKSSSSHDFKASKPRSRCSSIRQQSFEDAPRARKNASVCRKPEPRASPSVNPKPCRVPSGTDPDLNRTGFPPHRWFTSPLVQLVLITSGTGITSSGTRSGTRRWPPVPLWKKA